MVFIQQTPLRSIKPPASASASASVSPNNSGGASFFDKLCIVNNSSKDWTSHHSLRTQPSGPPPFRTGCCRAMFNNKRNKQTNEETKTRAFSSSSFHFLLQRTMLLLLHCCAAVYVIIFSSLTQGSSNNFFDNSDENSDPIIYSSLPGATHGKSIIYQKAAPERDLTLLKVKSDDSPLAKCLDGSPPAVYWRDGVDNGSASAVLFLEGGGWCYPSQVHQTNNANCAIRRNTDLGSSLKYPPSIPNTGYEGGAGFLSTDTQLSAFANWGVGYFKYCDGGSFSGMRVDPDPERNNSGGPIW